MRHDVGLVRSSLTRLQFWLRPLDRRLGFRLPLVATLAIIGTLLTLLLYRAPAPPRPAPSPTTKQ